MRPQLEAELQAHAHALRALARMLVGPREAEDLVQDTALQALRSPPPRGTGLWGWLAQVLRRLASNHHRGAQRRQRRERYVPPLEVPAPAVRVAEHREAVQRVTDALMALPEPYQGALLLRFFGDLTPTAIAAQTGVPLATVKSRLQRGLSMLRERLDAEAKDTDWRPALMAVLELPRHAATGAALTTGVLLMQGGAAKLAMGGAAAAAAAVTAFLFLHSQEPAPRAPQSGEMASAPALLTVPAPSAMAPDAGARHPAPELTAEPAAAGPVATLRGRCVDEQGRPLGGVQVELHGWPANSERVDAWTRDHDAVPESITEKVATASDGTFAFRCWPPPPFQFALSFTGDGFGPMEGRWSQLEAGSTKEVGDVVMRPGWFLHGRVVDSEGTPMAKAHVGLSGPAGTGEITPFRYPHAVTQADGTFTSHPAAVAGDYRLDLAPLQNPRPDRLTLGAGSGEVTIVVDKVAVRPEIAGIVVDEAGQPIALANVGVPRAPRVLFDYSSTDKEGRFRLKRPAREAAEVSLLAQADGYEDASTPERIAWGRDDVRLTLRRGLQVEVTAVTSDGTPVEDFQVRVFPDWLEREMSSTQYEVRARGRHPGGRVVIDGILRGAWYVLVEPKDERLAMGDFVRVQVADPGPARVTVTAPQRIDQKVCVRFADGAPVAGTTMQLAMLHGQEPGPLTFFVALNRGMWWQRNAALLLQELTTDASGDGMLKGPRDTPMLLSIESTGHVPLQRTVQFGSSEPLIVTVGRGARVTGKAGPEAALAEIQRLTGLAGEPKSDYERGLLPRVELVRMDGNRFVTHPRGKAARIAADGTFAMAGAPPGRWLLTVVWDELESTDQHGTRSYGSHTESIATLDLRDEATVVQDVDLSRLLPGELEATVLNNGEPFASARLMVSCITGKRVNGDDSHYSRAVTTDAEGRFHLRLRSGEYWLESWNRQRMLHGSERAWVVAGQTTAQVFHLDSGKLRLRLLDAHGNPVAGVPVDFWEPPDPRSPGPLTRQISDDQGALEVELDPLPLTLTVLPRRYQDSAAMQQLEMQARQQGPQVMAAVRIELARLTPERGRTTERELRLPPEWER